MIILKNFEDNKKKQLKLNILLNNCDQRGIKEGI